MYKLIDDYRDKIYLLRKIRLKTIFNMIKEKVSDAKKIEKIK